MRRSRVNEKLATATLQVQHSKLLDAKEKAWHEVAERADKIRPDAEKTQEQARRDAEKVQLDAERPLILKKMHDVWRWSTLIVQRCKNLN